MVTAFLSIYLVEIRGWTVGFVGLMFGGGRLIGIGAASLGGALASRFGEKNVLWQLYFPLIPSFY